MKKRIADRGDVFYSTDGNDIRVIQQYFITSDNDSGRCQWMGPYSAGSERGPYVPEWLHETPQKAFEAAKKRGIKTFDDAIADAKKRVRFARRARAKIQKLRVKSIKLPHPQTFERRLWEWQCD